MNNTIDVNKEHVYFSEDLKDKLNEEHIVEQILGVDSLNLTFNNLNCSLLLENEETLDCEFLTYGESWFEKEKTIELSVNIKHFFDVMAFTTGTVGLTIGENHISLILDNVNKKFIKKMSETEISLKLYFS